MRTTFATYRVDREKFAHSPKRQAPRWLYRLFKKAHAWLGEFVNEPVTSSIKTTTVDFSKKFDGILQHINEVQRTTGLRPKFLIVGREAYYELSGEILGKYPFMFPYPPDRQEARPDSLFGLQVVVVPWIDGMFCLPDLDRLIR
jgi:hypothetical protein